MDSNLHREHILLSEKAFAYKLKMEALSHQGAACGQAGHKSRDAVSDTDSGRQVQRYIRLTCLIPELLNKLDTGEMALSIGAELSYLNEQRQAKPVCRLTLLSGLRRKTSFLCGEKPETQSGILSLCQLQFRTRNVKIHYIRNVVLEKIVLEAVSSLADYVRCYEPVLLYFLAMQNNAEHQINLKVLRQSIDKGEQRIRQIDKAIEELFEANICGKITDERFIKMTASYEKEQKHLTASVENWKLELENAQQQEVNGRNRVKVDIYFTAVGMVNIPTETEIKAAMEEIQRSRKQAITT